MSTASVGWYFYGITSGGSLDAVIAADAERQLDNSRHAGPLQLLEFAGLAAVVRPVFLADFSQPVLRERLRDASTLETMVRNHNRVIEAVHAQQSILPAKFGVVYVNADEVMSALRPAHDTLLEKLHRLDGCAEWAVHLYADKTIAREHIAADDLSIRRLRHQRAIARPGRAYFLDQQIEDALASATEQALTTLADQTFERFA